MVLCDALTCVTGFRLVDSLDEDQCQSDTKVVAHSNGELTWGYVTQES
ncbi:MAG: hypothetical protein HXS45_07205 [Theionarchaea archaeon]|nr:hypothetical protein [Theionarchaea archaeon]